MATQTIFRSFMPVLFLALAWAPTAGGSEPSAAVEEAIDWAKEKQFWSFQAPKRQRVPKVEDSRWPQQPIDYFILARLEQRGLSPSSPAEKRMLLRRLTFDLTGLPPTPEEVDRFLRDKHPDAYVRTVDRLLNSSRFGERMASLWLPLARYAEDQAHQVGKDTKFFYPNAYRYREWVINAFNRDLPYDAFLKLQLAADQMGADGDDLAALGFIGLGPKYYNRNRLDVMADEWEDRVDTVTRTMLGLTVACARCHDHKFEPVTMADYYGLAGVFASTRMVNKAADGTEEKKDASAEQMALRTLHMVEDGPVTNLNIFLRGKVDRQGPVAERKFLRVLSGDSQAFSEGSGRKDLAEAIATRNNPLTARVIVNRLWSAFFGQAIVPTPSNLGHSGEKPVYPELLDDLAVRFMENGWSMKTLVREFVLSSTYRQSSFATAEQTRADAQNELLGRMPRRRLSIEQWRDATLMLSGQMEWEGGKSQELDDPENRRRTVYARISRLKLNDLLMQFDYPDANVHAEKRSVTTSPMQKLFLLNSPFVLEQAKAVAGRLDSGDDPTRVKRIYKHLFSREPDARELRLGTEFLKQATEAELSRWEQYAHLLLCSNEMLYVD